MGACDFYQYGKGKTLREAFDRAVTDAQWEHGHGGYTGTIAEKHSAVEIRDSVEQIVKRLSNPPANTVYGGQERCEELIRRLRDAEADVTHPERLARAKSHALMDLCDQRIDDKWGPAGAILIKPGEWLFFGMASE